MGQNTSRFWCPVAACLLAAVSASASASGAEPRARGGAGDDRTFRPTVIVRKGNGQGSGTIIASGEGETLVLTAAHVVRGPGALRVELHRYNLGVEHALPPGGWPLRLPAEVAASDPAGDVAVVRVRDRPAFPFVARVGPVDEEPAGGTVVTSVGIDGGERLRSWSTRVRAVLWLAMSPGAKPGTDTLKAKGKAARPDAPGAGGRPFLITAKAPVGGRSGGGLFLEDGRLVGVCVGRIDVEGKTALGVFASCGSVHRLLREHGLDAPLARPRRPVANPGRASGRAAKGARPAR